MGLVDPASIREALRALYRQMKVNKALPATSHGLVALAIDGHESHATYNRHCSGCLERRVKTRRGYRTQYYHRHVLAMLLGGLWLWVTTCSVHRVPTAAILRLGHARWDIENHGFNELVNHWHADHVYKHSANALLCFWLMAMLAFNLFHAFFALNLKPEVCRGITGQHVARLMAGELYNDSQPESRAPPM